MRRANLVSGVALAAFGLVMILFVIPAQIDEGPAGMMSPRLVPTLAMGLVVALSVLLALTNLPAADEAPQDRVSPISLAEAAAALKLAAVFALALALHHWIAPVAGAVGLVVGALLALGERRPLALLAMPAGVIGAVWVLFYQILGTAVI